MLAYPQKEAKVYNDLLHLGRVTLTEYWLVGAIRAAANDVRDLEAAKTLINNQISSWGQVQIRCTDIHDAIWRFAQQVTSGKQPKDDS